MMKTVVGGQWSVVSARYQTFHVSRLTSYVICCLLLTSCATQKVTKPTENGYGSVLKKWTREGKVYSNFETKLLINATFKTEEFRESYVREYSTVYMLDTEKVKKLAEDEIEAPRGYHEFFISIHTPIQEWSDLERKEPIWALYLVNEMGERVSPLEIKKLKGKGPNITRFFPYFDDWSVGYSVKFPLNLLDQRQLITNETKSVKFVMTGPPGRGELVWEIRP
ncbi:MAG: hypothetical protein Q7T53_11865 [Deltaproteobacteria bacterium]|nr:hypothetical protein [Deltaproteobacteria bacterium]